MRTKFAIIFCVACISGCAGVRQHWADGFGWIWNNSTAQIIRHGPSFVADAALEGAADAVDDKISDATAGKESPGERRQRKVDEMLDQN
jgi:hypothetical protein